MEPTKDELRVLAAVATGAAEVTVAEIAQQLGVPQRTVSRHLCSLFQQVGTVDTGQVAQDLRAQWWRDEGGGIT